MPIKLNHLLFFVSILSMQVVFQFLYGLNKLELATGLLLRSQLFPQSGNLSFDHLAFGIVVDCVLQRRRGIDVQAPIDLFGRLNEKGLFREAQHQIIPKSWKRVSSLLASSSAFE